jgi:hypothetical protein
MDCEVLRCGKPAASVLDVGTAGSGPVDVGLCAEHQSQIGHGARWLFEWQDGGAGRPGRLLMGRDLPPRVVRWKATGLVSPDGVTRVFSFEVENPDRSRREVAFELPPGEIADGVWRVLDRG